MPCSDNGQNEYHRKWEYTDKLANFTYFIRHGLREEHKKITADPESDMDADGSPSKAFIDKLTATLCDLCKRAPDDLLYNGRNRMARDLANWWEDHQKCDALREK